MASWWYNKTNGPTITIWLITTVVLQDITIKIDLIIIYNNYTFLTQKKKNPKIKT